MRLPDALRVVARINGGTNCAIPMAWAIQHSVPSDAFVLLTDNETWHSAPHPAEALERYRKQTARQAALVAVGLTATRGTVADVADSKSLSIVGFDASVPSLIADFVRE